MSWFKRGWVQVVLVWAVLVVMLSAMAVVQGDAPQVDGDDAMRLVEAIDLFHGQSWFDTTQYRDNTPFGAPMHWSRLIDAPIVGLIAVFTPIAHEAAPYWAAFVWPLLVLLAALAILAALTERLAGFGARLPALFFFAMALAAYTEFRPGRVDHHNVQIVLTLAMILCAIEGRFSRHWAALAGLSAATGLAIGTEVLPAVVATLACFALYWVAEPQRSRGPVLAFAASFPAALVAHLLIASPIQAWFVGACDALSFTYVIAGIGYGLAMVILVLAAPLLRNVALRVLGLGLFGALTLLIVLWLFPECRNGPYGNLDPVLADILMPDIGEAMPVWRWVGESWSRMGLLLLPIFGMVSVLVVPALVPPTQRSRWVVLAGFCLALFVVFCLQVRGFRIVSIAVLPAPAYLLWRVWRYFQSRQTLRAAALVMITAMAFMGTIHWTVFTRAFPDSGPQDAEDEAGAWKACIDNDAYGALAALPPSRLMSFLLIGPQLLLKTPHSIVSAGYHRNKAGLRDMVRFFGGGEASARAVAEERGLDYLVFCRGLPPTENLHGIPDFTGLSWTWLVPVSPPEAPLQIYAIDLTR